MYIRNNFQDNNDGGEKMNPDIESQIPSTMNVIPFP